MRRICRILEVALLAAAVAPATFAAETETESGKSGGGTFFAGVDIDNQDSHRLTAGVTHLSAGGTSFELIGVRSEIDSDSLSLSSTYAHGLLGHDFGDLGFAAGLRHLSDDSFADTLGLFGAAFLDFSGSRLTATIESRDTDFEDTEFTASGEELDLEGITSASGIASCSVASLGYGLRLEVIRTKWSFYASGTAFDYSSHECTATITETTEGSGPGPPVTAPVNVRVPSVVSRVVSGVGGGFAGYSARLVPRDGSLLESSVMAGASFALGSRYVLGFEVYGDSEEFAEAQTTTALAYFEFRATPQFSVTLTAGGTESDALDSSVFAGVRLARHFGR
ncbi:MAG: hypothetical protein WD793_12855 [Steroidobacteraceae bacterium]